MTSDLAVSEWPTSFPDDTCATALIDRIVHPADVIAIAGDDNRRLEAEPDEEARPTKHSS